MLKNTSYIIFLFCYFFIVGFSNRPQNDAPQNSSKIVSQNDSDSEKNILNSTDAAFAIAKRIQDPSARKKSLTAIAKAYATMGNHDRAKEIATLLAGAKTGSTRLMILSDIALTLASQSKYPEAISFVDHLSNPSEKDYIYENLALYFFSQNLINEAKSCMSKTTSPIILSRIQRKYIDVLLDSNNLDLAFDIAKSIKSISERESAFSSMCIGLAKAENYQALSNCLSEIQDADTKDQTYKTLVEVFGKNGDFKRSLIYLDLIHNPLILNQAQLMLIGYYAEKQKFESAYALSELITVDQLKSEALSKIAIELTTYNQLDNALDVIETIESETIRERTYVIICEKLAIKGRFEDALSVVKNINDPEKARLIIIQAATKFGERKDYLHPTLLINQIQEYPLRHEAMSAFLVSFAPFGSIDKLKELLNAISDPVIKEKTQVLLAERLASSNRVDDSYSILQLIGPLNLKAKTSISCAQRVATPLNPALTYPFLDMGVPIIEKVLLGQERLEGFLSAGDVYATINLKKYGYKALENAEKEIRLIQNPEKKSFYLTSIIQLYIRFEDYEKALELITELNQAEDWVNMFLLIPNSLPQNQQKKLIKQLSQSIKKYRS